MIEQCRFCHRVIGSGIVRPHEAVIPPEDVNADPGHALEFCQRLVNDLWGAATGQSHAELPSSVDGLEREGFEVLVAKDGLDAMQLLQETTPDAILTDIEMPRMDGFGLARNIRDDVRTANTPLIMISSRTADKHQNLAKEIGVDAFFGKPVQDDELINKVNELLAYKRVLP